MKNLQNPYPSVVFYRIRRQGEGSDAFLCRR